MNLGKTIVTALGIIAGTALVLVIFHAVITGGATVIKFPDKTPIEQQIGSAVQQSSATSQNSGQAPLQPGKDFTVEEVHYFDKKTWLIATIKPIDNRTNGGFVAMEKVGESYLLRLGPTGDFSDKNYKTLPADAAAYLKKINGTK